MVRAAEVTNWVVFNDYVPGPLPDPGTGWGTAPFVNVYNLRGTPGQPPEPTSGTLTNFLTGEPLAATIECVATGSPDYFGAINYPDVGTPAYNLFNGIVDIGNQNSAIGCRSSAGTTTTFTFHNLDPGKRYIFRGTAVRGNNYLNRWTKAIIQGAEGYVDAFTTGVYTKDNFPTGTLVEGEQVWNSGENRADGALVGWDEILPGADGSFSIHCEQYVDNPLPNGQAPALGNYGYAICGFMLAEVGEPTPIEIVSQPAPSTTVEENRPFSLSVSVTGSLPAYQWYKGDMPIEGATRATYSVDHASLEDAGNYYVVVKGFLSPEGVTSMNAEVIVNEDVTAPVLQRVIGSASLSQITLEFNEELDPGTAEDSFNFSAEDAAMNGLNIISATLTNRGTVVILETDPQAENTVYTVAATGITDLAGNSVDAEGMFTSWITSPGGGVLFEAFDTSVTDGANPGGLNVVSNLTNSATYPDDPFFRSNLSVFDTRQVFTDDSHNNYGGRLRGLFIAPMTGDWIFYMRNDDNGELYLNPAGPSASGKIRIIERIGAGGNWERIASDAFPLVAGQGYYIEALYKEGAGGDYCKVAAQLVGQEPPSNGDLANIDPSSLAGNALGSPAAPADIGGPLTIDQQPMNTSVEENQIVAFSVQASNPSDLPIAYQWKRDGLDIPDANGPSYSFRVTTDDNGAVFSVVVSKVGSSVTSADANLEVVTDVTPPSVVRISTTASLNQVIIEFSELMDEGTAADPFNYAIDGYTVETAVLDASGTKVVLGLNMPLAPGANYDLQIGVFGDVTDLAGNGVAGTETFPSFVLSRGFAVEQLYFDIGAGVLVSDLTGNPKYPDAPDRVRYINRIEGPTDTFDNYGTRITGYLVPPVSGPYNFYMSSDDGGQFALNMIPDDDDPLNLSVVCLEPTWNGSRDWVGTTRRNVDMPENRSTTMYPDGINLEAGRRYAFEALAKEGGGGDNLGVTWQLPGASVPVNGSAPINASYIYSLAEPRGALINFTQMPEDLSVSGTEPISGSFSVAVTAAVGGLPSGAINYQWQRDDGSGFVDIYGANSSTYTGGFGAADNGAQFRCLVFVPGVEGVSDAVTLSVLVVPSLSITYSGGVVTVSWPKSATDYVLVTKSSLADPLWVLVPPEGYQSDEQTFFITLPQPTEEMYFQLMQVP